MNLNDTMDANRTAALLAALVDTLIPGDGGWPAATTVGVQAVLAERLVRDRGEDALDGLIVALEPGIAALLGQDEAARIAAVGAFEAAAPELFGWVRDATYIAYYESPVVALAINASGHPYKLRPHVEGYALPRFDLSRDTPSHRRGGYTRTDAVRPIDAEALRALREGAAVSGARA